MTIIQPIKSAFLCVALLFCLNTSAVEKSVPDTKREVSRPDGKTPDAKKKLKVFILMGQSNMVGMGRIAGKEGSLEYAVKEKKKYPYLVDDKGAWVQRPDVRFVRFMQGRGLMVNDWLGIKGGTIGPEFGIGHVVGNEMDAPVMLLKTCIGNRSLGWDYLPPGSEPCDGQPGYRGTGDNPKGTGEKPKAGWYAGITYDMELDFVKEVLGNLGKYYPGATKYEIAGFFFWQGEKDGGNAVHAANYEKNQTNFIKALRKELNCPNAKFVLATMGEAVKGSGNKVMEGQFAVDGNSGKHPEFKGNVATVYTNPMAQGGGGNGHYGGKAEVYMDVGEAMGKAMIGLLKDKK